MSFVTFGIEGVELAKRWVLALEKCIGEGHKIELVDRKVSSSISPLS